MCYENSAGKYERTKTSMKTSVENVMFVSAKTVLSDIISIVKLKGNRLYDIFAMTVAFSDFHFAFRIFMLTFDLL